MPLYEYACDKCGDRFEVMQKFSDEPLTTHEKCGGAVHRLISAPALQFKGSGWYITDYAKNKSSSTASENGGSTTKGSDTKSTETTSGKSDSSSASPAPSTSASDSRPASSTTTK